MVKKELSLEDEKFILKLVEFVEETGSLIGKRAIAHDKDFGRAVGGSHFGSWFNFLLCTAAYLERQGKFEEAQPFINRGIKLKKRKKIIQNLSSLLPTKLYARENFINDFPELSYLRDFLPNSFFGSDLEKILLKTGEWVGLENFTRERGYAPSYLTNHLPEKIGSFIRILDSGEKGRHKARYLVNRKRINIGYRHVGLWDFIFKLIPEALKKINSTKLYSVEKISCEFGITLPLLQQEQLTQTRTPLKFRKRKEKRVVKGGDLVTYLGDIQTRYHNARQKSDWFLRENWWFVVKKCKQQEANPEEAREAILDSVTLGRMKFKVGSYTPLTYLSYYIVAGIQNFKRAERIITSPKRIFRRGVPTKKRMRKETEIALRESQKVLSLDHICREDKQSWLLEILPDPRFASPEEVYNEKNGATLTGIIKNLLMPNSDSPLSEREKLIMRLKYGFCTEDDLEEFRIEGYQPRTFREIREILGRSRQRYHQIKQRAVRKIRNHLDKCYNVKTPTSL